MTKYTLEQLLAMTNEQRDEIAGALQWKQLKGDWEMVIFDDPDNIRLVTEYHPSTNKEQMVDLMFKYRLTVDHETNSDDVAVYYPPDYINPVVHNGPLIAVVIASILHLQEIE